MARTYSKEQVANQIARETRMTPRQATRFVREARAEGYVRPRAYSPSNRSWEYSREDREMLIEAAMDFSY